MTINEFIKRWFFRYFHPSFFYLPMESCEADSGDSALSLKIAVYLYNTYNPIEDDYTNNLNDEGKQANEPCKYYRLLITYIDKNNEGEDEEKLVYCSETKSFKNTYYYETGITTIEKMADGSPLKFGKYRCRVWATFGLGVPTKNWIINYKKENQDKVFRIYTKWHLVSLTSKTGSPIKNWSASTAGQRWVTSDNISDYIHTPEGNGRPIYVQASISANNCLQKQEITDLFSKDLLCSVPFPSNPRSYYRSFKYGNYSIGVSQPCFSINENLDRGWINSWSDGAASFFQYNKQKQKLNISPPDIRTSYQIINPINISDIASIVPAPCPDTGNSGEIAQDSKSSQITFDYSVWSIQGINNNSYSGNTNLYSNLKEQNKTINSWKIYEKISIEKTQEAHAGQYGLSDYGETTVSYGGYGNTFGFTGIEEYIPLGGRYSTIVNAINYYNSDNKTLFYEYEENGIIKFSNTVISTVNESFELYDRPSFSFGEKEKCYSRQELMEKIPLVHSFKPWQKEVPKDKFIIELDENLGVKNYDISDAILFYKYNEQSFNSCIGYALINIIPLISDIPNIKNSVSNK